jgi:hypothetical protein
MRLSAINRVLGESGMILDADVVADLLGVSESRRHAGRRRCGYVKRAMGSKALRMPSGCTFGRQQLPTLLLVAQAIRPGRSRQQVQHDVPKQ